MVLLHICIIALCLVLLSSGIAHAKTLKMSFACSAKNDLYAALQKCGYRCPRYESPAMAVEHAKPETAVLILAEGYPSTPTKLEAALFNQAAAKGLRLYIEYSQNIPSLELGEPVATVWERGVVSSDLFGSSLKKGRILAIQGCRYLPVKAESSLIAIARLAGFDTAVYGIPEHASPILFEVPERKLIIATTKLSGFITGRYAPTEAWQTIWQRLLAMLEPDAPSISLKWQPTVAPTYSLKQKLPHDAEQLALHANAKWLRESKLLIHPSRQPMIHKLLAVNAPDTLPVPAQNEPAGDGSCGIQEGYASAINWDGSQNQFSAIRADCNAESAMVLAMDWMVHKNTKSKQIAANLTDFVYFNSGLCKGPRGNPKHPAYGLIAWGDVSPAWLVGNYGDDCARTMLGTILSSACLRSERWEVPLLRALLANLRTTGPQGFRGDRIDIGPLEQYGWSYFHDTPRTNYAPHFEAYLWACYLWAFRQTGYSEFLERARTAIKMTVEAYPDGWRWGDSMERARMLLPLAWLIRVDDTAEHRRWLRRIADDLLKNQASCGALREVINASGGGGHYFAPQSNEAYGTGETPLIQQNGDCASDQLYTAGYAMIGLHEGYAATGDAVLKQAEDRLADYLVRIQVRSPKHLCLDGTWFRAFDYKRWDYWASSGDAGWGAWSAEAGWAQAWTAITLGLRVQRSSFWTMTADVNMAGHFRDVKKDLAQTPDGPFL